MATGRTTLKHYRVYVDGYDLSGFGRTIGPLNIEYPEVDCTAYMSDAVKGYLRGVPDVNVGTLNAVFDNTAGTGLVALGSSSGVPRNVLVAIGIRGAPADGDPCFGGTFNQNGFGVMDDGGAAVATIPYSGWAGTASSAQYALPWGTLLHANAVRLAATGANTGTGFDNPLGAVSTTKGGYFMYEVTAGNGTATLSVDDSADNAAFLPLASATSGSISCVAGVSGIVAISTAATVRRYLRWQIAFGSATTVTFASAFMRSYS